MEAGVADRRHLYVLVLGLVDRVQSKEREEDIGLDALHAGPVGHDQPRVDPLEGALGDDDGDLLDGVAHLCLDLWMSRCSRAAWGYRRSSRRALRGLWEIARRAL